MMELLVNWLVMTAMKLNCPLEPFRAELMSIDEKLLFCYLTSGAMRGNGSPFESRDAISLFVRWRGNFWSVFSRRHFVDRLTAFTF